MKEFLIMEIKIGDYEQLKKICWNRDPEESIDGEKAFLLYENNWKHVSEIEMSAEEKELVARLTIEYGNGVMYV